MLLEGCDLLVKFVHFVVKTVLFDVLILSVLINLLTDLPFNYPNLLSLLAHFLIVLSDPDPLVMESFLLLVNCQLLCLLVRVHLRLLRGPDLIEAGLAFLNHLAELHILVTLARL